MLHRRSRYASAPALNQIIGSGIASYRLALSATNYGLQGRVAINRKRKGDGHEQEIQRTSETSDKVLTNRQGHPIANNQSQRTVGSRGPATLENYQFLEKITHFDRERIPERVVHARGFVCYGELEVTGKIGDEPASKYTRAKLFQEAGKKTPLAIRFSTVIGGRDSSEIARDPRGFAVKFYTEDGNWDLVGNNLAVFFIRDAIKFPDVIHSLKPDPGHVPPGTEPDLRLHEPDARIHAHADASVQPARHSGELSAHGGLRRQHLQDGQRPGRHRSGQVPLPSALRRRPA